MIQNLLKLIHTKFMSNHQVCFGSKSSKSAVVQPLGFLIYEWNTAWSGLRISVRFFKQSLASLVRGTIGQ